MGFLIPEIEEIDSNELTDNELNVISGLRDRGFTVTIFSPDELGNANTDKVEDRLVELGWDIINDLKS